MSFGFAVGDFIAVGKLIHDIIDCLQSVGGARSEYQELIREFETLKTALQRLDKLGNSTHTSPTIDSIKFAALSCRHTLEEFLSKARNYDQSLGLRGGSSLVRRTKDKLRWSFAQKDDVERLQHYLNIHIGTINILLIEHGFERMEIARDTADAHNTQVRQQLTSSQSYLTKITNNISQQTAVWSNVQSAISGLPKLICGELKASWNVVERTIARIWYVPLLIPQ